MKKIVSNSHFIVSILTLSSVVAEFFLAGLGVFGATTFSLHKVTGEVIMLASFLLLLLSIIGLLGRKRILFSLLLVILMLIQNVLVHVHNPYIEAVHPLNGLAVMGISAMLVRTGDLTAKSKSQAAA